jgi:O-antigen/teichoic acid export membrane protein
MNNNWQNTFAELLQKILGKNRATTLNLIIRGFTLAGKFLLVIFLADYLSEEQMGEWGIFSTSISLSLYLVGLDFYTYSTRTILEYPLHERSRFLRDQFVFYIISYVILFPLLLLLFVFGVMEFKMMVFFYIILILEHLAQEAYRTFVVFSKPVWANIILFLRTGSWTYILLILWFSGIDELKTLKSAMTFWIIGGASAIIASVFFLSRFHFQSVKGIPVNWNWIKQGVKLSLLFFLGTIGFKLVEFSDRYFLVAYDHSKEMVGIYTLYANMANMIEIFVHTTTIITFSPMLINYFIKNKTTYYATFNRFAKHVMLFNVLAAVILAIIMYPVLQYIINKESYNTHLESFVVLVASEMVFNISLIFHYILYIRKSDFSIVKATILAAFTNILLNFIFIPSLGINGASLSTLLSFIMLLLMKAYYARHYPEVFSIVLRIFSKKKSSSSEF